MTRYYELAGTLVQDWEKTRIFLRSAIEVERPGSGTWLGSMENLAFDEASWSYIRFDSKGGNDLSTDRVALYSGDLAADSPHDPNL